MPQKHWILFASLTVALAGLPSPVRAQAHSRGVELGFDAALQHYTYTYQQSFPAERGWGFMLPVGAVRGGFFLSDIIEIEPAIGYHYATGGGGSTSQLNLDVGVPIGRNTNRQVISPYIRPFLGVARSAFSPKNGSGSSRSQGSVGAGLGLRLPAADHFGGRIEAFYRRAGQVSNLKSADLFGLSFGFSFFTR